MNTYRILVGDAAERLKTLDAGSVHCCVTSPPYWGLRSYGAPGDRGAELEVGREPTPQAYIDRLVEVFEQVRRVLRNDGTLWVNIGDCYCTVPCVPKGRSTDPRYAVARNRTGSEPNRQPIAGIKHKDLLGLPWMLAFALRSAGWYLRADIIWTKPNGLPESVKDRVTRTHEYLFMFTKSAKYFYNADAIREPHSVESLARVARTHHKPGHKWENGPGDQTIANDLTAALHPKGRNKRSVWSINTEAYRGAHFAVMPRALVRPCLLAGCPEDGMVLDPFAGVATVGLEALCQHKNAILCELYPQLAKLARNRIAATLPDFGYER